MPSTNEPFQTPQESNGPLDVANLFRLDGSVAVVTGASSGLGHRFARVLQGAGAVVVVGARRIDRLATLATQVPDIVPVQCDVTDPEGRQALIATARSVAAARGRRFDVLVNNAGIGIVTPAIDESFDDFTRVMEVNVAAVFALSQLAARHFIADPDVNTNRTGGTIVNIASMLGQVASAPINQAGYVASKHAVVGLTRELGCQWARKGVRVNALAPGWFVSEMTDDSMFGDDASMAFLRRNTPIGRGGNEDELDGALLLLASQAGSYLVGQTLTVDGGWTAR